jgi:hypothetical protein
VRALQSLIDDTEVMLAFYGSIVYLALVSALGAQHEQPAPMAAISTIVATATVLYIAHVFAALVPKAARAGRMRPPDVAAGLRHDAPLLVTAIVPVVPLALATWGVVAVDTGYRLSVRISIAMLFGVAVSLGRRDGLGWARALTAGLVIVAAAIVVIFLESHVH